MQSGLIDDIRAAMRAAFPHSADEVLLPYYGMMEYHLGWRNADLQPEMTDPGKLIRPRLVLLACRALGGDAAHALPLAAGLQLLHDFTLIHDDIEDQSVLRRGRPTVWKLWGREIAINVGDGLFAVAHRSLQRLPDVGVEPATALDVLRGFEETILRICEGQHLDMTGEGRFDVDERRYLAMIGGKTAALLGAATGLGARLATDDAAQVTALGSFGEALGLAFQMQDDLLDIWGDPQLTGKPYAADLVQRKMSLPVIHAYIHALTERATLERIYRQERVGAEDVQALLNILDAAGSRDHVGALMRREHDRAIAALEQIRPVDHGALAALRSLADSLLDRAW